MNNLKELPERSDRYYGKRFNGVYPVSGIVHVIRDDSELRFFREGEILLASYIDPAWKKQLSLAKAIIEDAAAEDSRVEALASQYDIPAIAGVADAMTLRSYDIVTLSADGEIELHPERRAPDSPMRVSVPAAVEARDQNRIITAPNVLSLAAHKKDLRDKQQREENIDDDLLDEQQYGE